MRQGAQAAVSGSAEAGRLARKQGAKGVKDAKRARERLLWR